MANVLTNAIRYAGHALLITIEEEDEQLVISVNDDGAGYPQHARAPAGLCAGHRSAERQHRAGFVLRGRTSARTQWGAWAG
jgi:anti-sigma regulatory factor (Ser/Thr protein kinase)